MVSLIVALTAEYVIGKDNKVPWKIPDDMKFFKDTTMGNPVIMGKRTWESIPEKYRPLPGRQNIVVSSSLPEAKGADVCRSLEDAIGCAQSYGGEPFLAGGARIYGEALARGLVDTMYLTWVDGEHEGDTVFPKVNWELWEEKESIALNGATVKVYTKVER